MASTPARKASKKQPSFYLEHVVEPGDTNLIKTSTGFQSSIHLDNNSTHVFYGDTEKEVKQHVCEMLHILRKAYRYVEVLDPRDGSGLRVYTASTRREYFAWIFPHALAFSEGKKLRTPGVCAAVAEQPMSGRAA
jgi:hypothetical protein